MIGTSTTLTFAICSRFILYLLLSTRLSNPTHQSGNSDAAGHGNFFGEQYTMVMADRAKDLFHSVGLDLVARPFGIGGATSAPEIAGCAKEIFGTDVDLITWDFSMTDGRWYWRKFLLFFVCLFCLVTLRGEGIPCCHCSNWRHSQNDMIIPAGMEMFAHRVMMLPNHPVLLVLQPGTEPKRREIVDHLTNQGMGVLRQDEKYVIDRQLQFPDSRFRNEHELAAMPDAVRWFKCGFGIVRCKPSTTVFSSTPPFSLTTRLFFGFDSCRKWAPVVMITNSLKMAPVMTVRIGRIGIMDGTCNWQNLLRTTYNEQRANAWTKQEMAQLSR